MQPRVLSEDEWVEPRSPREKELQVKLLRTQKELHRCRGELSRRGEHTSEAQKRKEEGKPDWTLADGYATGMTLLMALTGLPM